MGIFDKKRTKTKEQTFYTVCAAETEGAIPLYNELGGEVCRHVIERAYSAEEARVIQEAAGRLILCKGRSSGFGASFGTAGDNKSENVDTEPISLDTVVLEGGQIVGCAVNASNDRDTMDGRSGYVQRVYLPVGDKPRKIDCSYYYHFYPYDGTSSEYSRTVYAAVVKL